MEFKVGDFVRGTSGRYSITNHNMTKGKVVNIRNYQGQQILDVQILELNDPDKLYEVGKVYEDLYARHFEKIEDFTMDSVKLVYSVKFKGTFIIIGEKHIVFTDARPEDIGISTLGEQLDPIETAKALALYRAK